MPAAPLPLLTWQEDEALARLAADRENLMARIARLRPMSHRRVELIARLKQLTDEELRLQLQRRQAE